MTTCSNVETRFKEKTVYLPTVIFLCLRCVLSEIGLLLHCRNKQVFSEGGFPKRVSSRSDILRVLFYSCDGMRVFPQVSPSRLSLTWVTEWIGWLAGRACVWCHSRYVCLHSHPGILVSTRVGCCGHALMCNMLNSSASSCVCCYLHLLKTEKATQQLPRALEGVFVKCKFCNSKYRLCPLNMNE